MSRKKTATLLITNEGTKVVEIDPNLPFIQAHNTVTEVSANGLEFTRYTVFAEGGKIIAVYKTWRTREGGRQEIHDHAYDSDTTFVIEGVAVSGTKFIDEQKTTNKWVNRLLAALI